MRALLAVLSLMLLALAPPARAADRPDDLVLRASQLVSTGSWGEAAAVLDRALAVEPNHLRGLYYRALSRLKLGDASGASTDLARYEALATDPADQELGQSLRVQVDNAQPAAPKPAPKSKPGPEVGFVVAGAAVAAAGATFLATGLARANGGAADLDRARWGSGESLYYAGLAMTIGGGVGALLGIPVGVAHRNRPPARVSVAAAPSPGGGEIGFTLTW